MNLTIDEAIAAAFACDMERRYLARSTDSERTKLDQERLASAAAKLREYASREIGRVNLIAPEVVG